MLLLGRWTRLAQGHIAMGNACSCGTGFGTAPRVADFEQDLLDYLHARRKGEQSMLALFADGAGYRAGTAGSVSALLKAIARGRQQAPVESLAALLDDLERSIDSFGSLHA